MDFKDLLGKLDQLNEAEMTSRKIAGKAYGGSAQADDDEEDEDGEKKPAAPAVKRGRGRPRKAGGEAETSAKYGGAAELQKWIVGSVPKKSKELEKLGKTKHKLSDKEPEKKKVKESLKDWIAELDQLMEAEQLTIEPAKAATQVIKQGNRVLGQVSNPQLAATIKQAIGKGEMSLAGSELDEEGGEKWIQKAVKHPGAFTKKAQAAGKSVAAFAKEKEHAPGTLGKQARLAKTLRKMHEADMPPNDALASPLTLESKSGPKAKAKSVTEALRKGPKEMFLVKFEKGGKKGQHNLLAKSKEEAIQKVKSLLPGLDVRIVSVTQRSYVNSPEQGMMEGLSDLSFDYDDDEMYADAFYHFLDLVDPTAKYPETPDYYLNLMKKPADAEDPGEAKLGKKLRAAYKKVMATGKIKDPKKAILAIAKAWKQKHDTTGDIAEGMMEGMDPEKKARLYDLIDEYRRATDPEGDDYESGRDPEEILSDVKQEFGNKIANDLESGTDKMHFPRPGHSRGYDPMSWRRPVDRLTKAGKMYKQDSDYRKNTIKSRYNLSGKSVTEGMDQKLKAAHHRGKAHALAKEGYNCRYDEGTEEARMYHEGYKMGLDECYGIMPMRGVVVGEETPAATVPGMASQAMPAMEDEMEEGNAFTAALAKTPHGSEFEVGGEKFTDTSDYDAKVDEMMMAFEGWDKQLNDLLTEGEEVVEEGMSISVSKGQMGAPDSVSVTANDADADKLMALVKQMGILGGEEVASDYGASHADHDTVHQHGDVTVVDDHDGMMALIKKVAGSGMDQGSEDYADEMGSDMDHHHEHGEVCGDCGMPESECGCHETEMVDEVESEDQMEFEVSEDNPPDSGEAEEATEIADTRQANASAADSGGAEDLEEESDEEDEEDEEEHDGLEESFANSADDTFEANMEFMINDITGGVNGRKSTGQTTVPVIPGQKDRMGVDGMKESAESIMDWKKLAGIK